MKSNHNDSKLIWEGMQQSLDRLTTEDDGHLGDEHISRKYDPGLDDDEIKRYEDKHDITPNPTVDTVMGDTDKFKKGDLVRVTLKDGVKLLGRVTAVLPSLPGLDADQGWVAIDRTGDNVEEMIVNAANVALVPSVDTSEHDEEQSINQEPEDMSQAEWNSRQEHDDPMGTPFYDR